MAMLPSNSTEELPENSDINVTPFIDVMLVLLIIFMVVAPLSTVTVPLDLPSSTAEPQPQERHPVVVSLQQDLSITLDEDTTVTFDTLGESLEKATQGNHEQVIFIRADKRVDYDHLMQMLNRLQAAGFLKVSLIGREALDP